MNTAVGALGRAAGALNVATPAAATRSENLPCLDGLRALACLLVVLSHLPADLPKALGVHVLGSLGVAIFFSLSGFLMAHLYARSEWNMQAVARYGIARAARILPIYWLVVLVSFVAFSFVDPQWPYPIDGWQLLRHLACLGSVRMFWSISPEIQYYVFFVALWYALWALRSGRWLAPLVVAVALGVLFATRADWPGLALPSKLQFFVLGSAVALVPRERIGAIFRHRLLAPLPLLAIALLVVWSLSGEASRSLYLDPAFALLAAATVLLCSFDTPLLRAVLGGRLMRLLGRTSFSIYLLHVLLIELTLRALGIATPTLFEATMVAVFAVALSVVISLWVEFPLHHAVRGRFKRLAGQA